MLTLVIPCYYNAPALDALLTQIGAEAEVIVSLSSKDNGCLAVAARHGVVMAIGTKGRGRQLARGAQLATVRRAGHWLLFLHADSHLPDEWASIVEAHINNEPQKAAYFKFGFTLRGFWPRVLELGVALRCRLLALPYGDQGLLIRADHYQGLGGFRLWDNFEDVAMVQAIGRGRLVQLPAILKTDAGKYERDGFLWRSLKNVSLLARYLAGGQPDKLSRRYNA